jgi:hypothetical protein
MKRKYEFDIEDDAVSVEIIQYDKDGKGFSVSVVFPADLPMNDKEYIAYLRERRDGEKV